MENFLAHYWEPALQEIFTILMWATSPSTLHPSPQYRRTCCTLSSERIFHLPITLSLVTSGTSLRIRSQIHILQQAHSFIVLLLLNYHITCTEHLMSGLTVEHKSSRLFGKLTVQPRTKPQSSTGPQCLSVLLLFFLTALWYIFQTVLS